jgi:hypothetical protein
MFQGSFSLTIYNNLAFSFLWPINKAATRIATIRSPAKLKSTVEPEMKASDYPGMLLIRAGLWTVPRAPASCMPPYIITGSCSLVSS